ncbi:type VI secretion system lipoprotein TssJ [uncultured Roseobacter sp.]|uniref:type VI secretion system lipoprotein TssJ n=1 Tax=uncultured Roseobacter sp. TaxID=114847 RepID=UPI00261ED072|nr:type VI secretion system lipoprotein TssJ [uncultured Roseobacter sp.]
MITRRRLLFSSLALTLSGCAARGPASTDVALTINGAADMNGGAPVEVKVMYLTDANAFRTADFFALFGTPEATLGADLISTQSFLVTPNTALTDARSFAQPPAAIGVIAAFRDITGTFRATRGLTPDAPNPVTVTLSGNRALIR